MTAKTATKTAAKKPAAEESEEIGWTVRMPRELAELVKEHAAELTAQGNGKWTGNMVIVHAISEAAKTWRKKAA